MRQFWWARTPAESGTSTRSCTGDSTTKAEPSLPPSPSAIDIALWDILGKHLNTPSGNCWGEPPASRSPAISTDRPGPATATPIRPRICQQGLEDHPLRPRDRRPRLPPGPGQHLRALGVHDWTADQIREARKRVGPGIRLAIDYHHRLNVAEAAAFCQRIRDVDLMFLEEPIRSESPDAYAALRAMTPMPFAIERSFRESTPLLPSSTAGWPTTFAWTSATWAVSPPAARWPPWPRPITSTSCPHPSGDHLPGRLRAPVRGRPQLRRSGIQLADASPSPRPVSQAA